MLIFALFDDETDSSRRPFEAYRYPYSVRLRAPLAAPIASALRAFPSFHFGARSAFRSKFYKNDLGRVDISRESYETSNGRSLSRRNDTVYEHVARAVTGVKRHRFYVRKTRKYRYR